MVCERCQMEMKKKPRFDFALVYSMYPRKIGKRRGFISCRNSVKTKDDFERMMLAVRNYRAYCIRENKEGQYIYAFSTWANNWEEWADKEAGTCDLTQEDATEATVLRLQERIG